VKKQTIKNFGLITNDVETTSLWNHCLRDKTGEIVLKEGMPLLLEAYAKFNIKATFYFTGYIARLFPDIVRMVLPYGHEVGCHGMVHDPNQAFDVLVLENQIDHLTRAKGILENICQHEVVSFRAPALRVNQYTPIALAKTGFKTDSSIAPQRIDMFMSFGARQKLKWIGAPRAPYYTKFDDLSRKGKGSIFEIPVSSFLLPYAGTIMRISPQITKIVRSLLDFEVSKTGRPLVFLIHPNELIEEIIEGKNITRRGKNYLAFLLGDKLRYHLKLKNLGKKALPLLMDQLRFLQDHNYEFITVKDYYTLSQKENNEAISKES
jgi:peptidoglycan/xylan/chitin deacetylase (PgdA/CDA1 family)